jgi:hypothetical protein
MNIGIIGTRTLAEDKGEWSLAWEMGENGIRVTYTEIVSVRGEEKAIGGHDIGYGY